MEAEKKLIKIGELARRAGVNRGTIQHYLREGLLPRPVKTHRNMAYYDLSYVDRIKQIRDLQAKRFLPLSVIAGLLRPSKSEGGLARTLVEAQEAALDALTPPSTTGPLTLEAAAKGFGLERSIVEELARTGLITPREENGERRISGIDIDVLGAVAHLERLGFTRRIGFEVKDLVMYREALQELLNEEVRAFLRVVAGRKDSPALAKKAVDGATMLIVALRRKLIADLLASVNASRVLGPPKAKKRR